MPKTKIHWCEICGRNVRHSDVAHGIRARKEKKMRSGKTKTAVKEK